MQLLTNIPEPCICFMCPPWIVLLEAFQIGKLKSKELFFLLNETHDMFFSSQTWFRKRLQVASKTDMLGSSDQYASHLILFEYG